MSESAERRKNRLISLIRLVLPDFDKDVSCEFCGIDDIVNEDDGADLKVCTAKNLYDNDDMKWFECPECGKLSLKEQNIILEDIVRDLWIDEKKLKYAPNEFMTRPRVLRIVNRRKKGAGVII